MGLWLKCPQCSMNNPLYLQVCPRCGHSLENLPRTQRVYVIGEPEAAAPKTPAAAAARPKAPRPGPQPKKSRPKKK